MKTPENSSSRASEVWRCFTGMFGGDALERKYGKTIPPEWPAMLARLKDYEVDRGVRRLAYSGKAHVPALPEFVKLCRMVGGDEVDEGPKPLALPAPDDLQGDEWDVQGNTHLLGHILRRTRENPRCYGPIKPFFFKVHPDKRMENPASEQQAVSTQILLRYKRAWSTDMREWGVDETTGEILKPTPEQQKAAWDECMSMAEAEIAQMFRPAA